MKKSDHHVWVNALREALGLDPIPFTAREEEDPRAWLPDGGLDFSTGEEVLQFPAAQARHFKRLTIRNIGA